MKVTSAATDFHAALARVADGGTLDAEESARIFRIIMTGTVAEDDLADFLRHQAERGPTVPEIVGAVRAMRAQMHDVAAPADAIDLCGTGGDGHGTLNISTPPCAMSRPCENRSPAAPSSTCWDRWPHPPR
jgi:anthranilate phosphoribosyltransferase